MTTWVSAAEIAGPYVENEVRLESDEMTPFQIEDLQRLVKSNFSGKVNDLLFSNFIKHFYNAACIIIQCPPTLSSDPICRSCEKTTIEI